MFQADPFNIAPGAPRHPPAAWAALLVGLLFAAACSVPFVISLRSVARAEQERIHTRGLQQARRDAEAADKRARTEPRALARIKAQQALQDHLRMSWTGLFDALEQASGVARGGATVLSLTPVATGADGAQISITAMASSVPVMLDYVRSLRGSEHVRDVQLTSQQPATGTGATTIGFQLTLHWVTGSGLGAGTATAAPGLTAGESR